MNGKASGKEKGYRLQASGKEEEEERGFRLQASDFRKRRRKRLLTSAF